MEPLLDDRYNYTSGNASLNYVYAGRENTFSAAGGTGLRYYSAGTNTFYPSDFYGGANFTRQLNRRFRMRIADPLKQWKLSPMDLQSRVRWEDYTKAKE